MCEENKEEEKVHKYSLSPETMENLNVGIPQDSNIKLPPERRGKFLHAKISYSSLNNIAE